MRKRSASRSSKNVGTAVIYRLPPLISPSSGPAISVGALNLSLTCSIRTKFTIPCVMPSIISNSIKKSLPPSLQDEHHSTFLPLQLTLYHGSSTVSKCPNFLIILSKSSSTKRYKNTTTKLSTSTPV